VSAFFFFFDGTEILTKGFMLAKQVVYYCLSHTPAVHFCSGYLEIWGWGGLMN
jgi:hypothetical protein